MSDRPIGCLLSGGLDSSIITSIVCKLLGPDNVRTYSVGMEGACGGVEGEEGWGE